MGILGFRQVDQKATAKKVRKFFDDDFMLCVRKMNRRPQDLKSPQYDPQPKRSTIGNSIEEAIIEHIDLEEVYRAVAVAIRNCSRRSNLILVGRYLDGIPDSIMQERLGLEHTHYGESKNWALNEFADRVQAQLPSLDLHVYK